MSNHSLSVKEVADLLGISKNTVYDLIKRNELPSYRVGHKLKIDIQDIESYKAKSKTAPIITSTNIVTNNAEVLVGSFRVPTDNSYMQNTLKSTSSPNLQPMQNNLIVCGQDMLLDILTSHLDRPPYNFKALRSYIGSYNGLVELYKGNVSIASAHLWDSETNTYNLPYLRSLLPGFSCVVVNLAYRMQGFYVAKGNPKSIQNWSDLTNPDVVMINRELGCGVRVLIDESIRKNNINKSLIKGYGNMEFSHIAVASAVARGDADVAVGNEKTSYQVNNIDFIPIQQEQLDLIIPKDLIYDPSMQAVLQILNSQTFKAELSGIGSYDISDTGKIIAEV